MSGPRVVGRECRYCGQSATVRVTATHRRGIVPRRVCYCCEACVDVALGLFPSSIWDIAIVPMPNPTICDRCGRDLFNIDGKWSDTESDTAILGSGQVCPMGGKDGLLHIVNGSPTGTVGGDSDG